MCTVAGASAAALAGASNPPSSGVPQPGATAKRTATAAPQSRQDINGFILIFMVLSGPRQNLWVPRACSAKPGPARPRLTLTTLVGSQCAADASRGPLTQTHRARTHKSRAARCGAGPPVLTGPPAPASRSPRALTSFSHHGRSRCSGDTHTRRQRDAPPGGTSHQLVRRSYQFAPGAPGPGWRGPWSRGTRSCSRRTPLFEAPSYPQILLRSPSFFSKAPVRSERTGVMAVRAHLDRGSHSLAPVLSVLCDLD